MSNETRTVAPEPPESLPEPLLVNSDGAFLPKLYHALRELQKHCRQTYLGDPDIETRVFRHCAPAFIFLCIFALGVVFPRHAGLKARASENPIWTLLVFGVGALGALGVLRGVIWVGARLVREFCDMDFGQLRQGREGKGKDFQLNAANLLVGGLF